MEKNEIISRVEEILHNKYDAGGIDSELVEDCVDSTLEAINYTHSCTELKSKKALTFEGWLKDNDKQYIYDDFIEGSFTYSMGSWYREYLKDVK